MTTASRSTARPTLRSPTTRRAGSRATAGTSSEWVTATIWVRSMRRSPPRGSRLEADWRKQYEAYQAAHPDLAAQLERRLAGRLADGWDADLPTFAPTEAQATRAASGKVLNAIASKLPELIGGSADLAGSTNVVFKNGGDVAVGSWGARNIHFGVREHGMGAIMNGLALHGGVRPVGST